MPLYNRLTRLPFRFHLPPRTIRMRLTVLYGALFLLSGAGLLAITYVLMVHATDRVIFKGQDGTGVVVGSGPGMPSPNGPPTMIQCNERAVVGSGERAPSPSPHVSCGATDLTPKQAEAQIRQLQAQALQQHETELRQLLIQSAIALAVMAVASIALGWIVAGHVLRPLRTITAAARDISASNLHERLALGGPDDELKELGDTFDGLLGRLETSFRSQRQFVANASHELRTPLARQRTLAQIALSDPDATIQSLRAAHERVLTAGQQQERLIEALLTLARGEAGLDRREPLDLAHVTSQALLAREREAARRGLDLAVNLDVAPTSGNPRLVERLVANLLDNALRHNVSSGRVEVTTGISAGRAVLSVRNTGPVVPVSEVGRLFQPFQRMVASRTRHDGGLGLGLSIVQAIATAHDATVAAHARPGGGMQVTVTFPGSSAGSTGEAAPAIRPALASGPHSPAIRRQPRLSDPAGESGASSATP